MLLWIVPGALILLAAVPVLLLVRRAREEIAALRLEMAYLAALREPSRALGVEVGALRAGVKARQSLRAARPAPSSAP